MRGLTLIDLLIVFAVVALLLLAGRQDFGRYAEHPAAPATTPAPDATP